MVLKLLGTLLSQGGDLATTSILHLYNQLCIGVLSDYGVSLPPVTRGKRYGLFKRLTYAGLANELTTPSVSNRIQVANNLKLRTIHSAKGETLKAVLVVFPDEATFERLLLGGLDDEEDESRIYYVGLSRASDLLYMHLPTMSPAIRETLGQHGIEVVHVSSSV